MEHRSSSADAKPAYRQVSITTLGKITEDNRPPKLSFPTPLRKIQTRGVSMPITEHVNDATSHQVKEEPTEGASLKPSKNTPPVGILSNMCLPSTPAGMKLHDGSNYSHNGACPLCPKTSKSIYASVQALNKHLRMKHEDSRASEINHLIGHKVYSNCPKCGKLFSKKLDLHTKHCKGSSRPIHPHVDISPVLSGSTETQALVPLSGDDSEELEEMRPFFCTPLQYTHFTWRNPLRLISESLLKSTMKRSGEPRSVTDAFNCLFILPGMVQCKRNLLNAANKKRRSSRSTYRVLDFLNDISSHTDPIRAILHEARALEAAIKRKWNKRVPTIDSQKRKCEKLINDGRYFTQLRTRPMNFLK